MRRPWRETWQKARYLSEHTVESHRSSAHRKLAVRSRTQLASKLAP